MLESKWDDSDSELNNDKNLKNVYSSTDVIVNRFHIR
jgi:hypothetical protein